VQNGGGLLRRPRYSQTMISPTMRKLIVAVAIAGVMALVLLVAGTAQNHGCLPWKTAVHTGGSAFSEGDRGHTYCR
jgi:hypothetical protein